MSSMREFVQTVDKLIELTQIGSLDWARYDPPRSLTGSGNRVDFVYDAEYEGQDIRVYEHFYKSYHDEYEYQWNSEVVIELIDSYGVATFRFPATRNSRDLLRAIQYEKSGVADFLNKFNKKN
ncbi:hypothetical protein ACK25U_11800 [Ectopseudomonas mendocina]